MLQSNQQSQTLFNGYLNHLELSNNQPTPNQTTREWNQRFVILTVTVTPHTQIPQLLLCQSHQITAVPLLEFPVLKDTIVDVLNADHEFGMSWVFRVRSIVEGNGLDGNEKEHVLILAAEDEKSMFTWIDRINQCIQNINETEVALPTYSDAISSDFKQPLPLSSTNTSSKSTSGLFGWYRHPEEKKYASLFPSSSTATTTTITTATSPTGIVSTRAAVGATAPGRSNSVPISGSLYRDDNRAELENEYYNLDPSQSSETGTTVTTPGNKKSTDRRGSSSATSITTLFKSFKKQPTEKSFSSSSSNAPFEVGEIVSSSSTTDPTTTIIWNAWAETEKQRLKDEEKRLKLEGMKKATEAIVSEEEKSFKERSVNFKRKEKKGRGVDRNVITPSTNTTSPAVEPTQSQPTVSYSTALWQRIVSSLDNSNRANLDATTVTQNARVLPLFPPVKFEDLKFKFDGFKRRKITVAK
ncbi:hypothetical protein HDU76_009158, partial [Blyttiomyces sp. JEL0837]